MKLLRLQTAAVLFLVVLVGLPSLSLAQGPSSATCQAIEKDGGFENGDAWRFTDTPSPGFLDASVAHSGRQSAFLGLPLDAENIEADSTVWQTLQLPASDVITATMWLRTQPGDANDRRYVVVWDLAEDASTVLFYDQAPEEAWHQITLDLTPFAGKEIQLVVGVHNDGADQKAGMWVDDVSVLACSETAASTQTPIPSATPSPTPQVASPTPAPTATPTPEPPATPTPAPTATPLPTATPTIIPYTGSPMPPGPMPDNGSLPLLAGVLLSGLIAVGVIAISLRHGRTL